MQAHEWSVSNNNGLHTWALDIHEVRVGMLNKPLQLALAPLIIRRWV